MLYKIMCKIYSIYNKFVLRKNLLNTKDLVLKGKLNKKIAKNAKINIKGKLKIGENAFAFNSQAVSLRMDKNSIINVEGNFSAFYGCDIVLFEGAILNLGNSFVNSDAKIRCHKSISIGNGCAISHDFTVMDSNAHYLNGDKKTRPVVIEDDVWIGTRVTILSGITVGKGAVIAAGSVVTKDVPSRCVVAGNPARVIKENVEWCM